MQNNPAEEFRDLMRRVRAGDGEAATQLVRRYEAEIRRAIRIQLTDPRLRRTLDSMDICQSVLGTFFVRVAAGEYDLAQPDELLRLLLKMAHNKLVDKARYEQADRRDTRRAEAPSLSGIPDPVPGPHTVVANRELLDRAVALLTSEERYLFEQRANQRPWQELAEELGSSAEALRKQYTRALDRVMQELEYE